MTNDENTYIGMSLPEGIRYITIFKKGDFENCGRILRTFYRTEDRVRKLLALGNLLHLGGSLTSNENKTSCWPLNNGNPIHEAKEISGKEKFFLLGDWTYLYENGRWFLGYEGKIYEISNPEFSVFVPDKDHTPSTLDKGLSFAVIGETGKLEFNPEIVNGWDTWKSLPKRVSEKGKTVYVFRKTQLIKVIKPKKTGIMKEISMTKAISCMPDKFITMEMVELAATEHRPELVNYLPEKYITSEILDSIFKTDDYGWRSWQLSKIPEEKRNRQICLRAIKAEKSNFPDIPEKYRNSDILESLFAHRNFMHYLHLIPSSSWNNGTVRDAIYSLYRDVQQNGGYRYCSERYEQQFLYETSVMLSFVPRQAKDFRLWKELIHDGRIATMTIDKMMPKCFKQAAYYKEWAIRCIKEVDTRWLDYDTVWKAICHKTGNLHGIFDSYGHYEWFSKHADDAMADKAMELEPNLFNKLPRRFRTPERLIHTLEVKREINSYNFILEPNLMTKEVCMALARRDSFYPDIPSERWNRELVEYFTEYGNSMYWFPQLPKKLQTRKLAGKVLKEKPQYFHYLRMEFITPEMSRLLCQKDQDNIRHFKERVMEFQKYTGLPAEFYGCETDFEHIRDRDDSRRYCRIGLAYIALQKCKRGWHESEYYLIMTRHPNRYMPAETVFRKQITTFHRTWLEKTICDNDPQFRIPKIQKDLKDVQAMRYYEVEHIRTILGCEIFRNSFMGQTVEYCIRKDGLTYHDRNMERLASGLQYKIRQLKEQAVLPQGTDDSIEINAETVHRNMGYCLIGIEAFAEDYGLDVARTYTLKELKDVIHEQGYKPSLEKYKKEVQHLNLI